MKKEDIYNRIHYLVSPTLDELVENLNPSEIDFFIAFSAQTIIKSIKEWERTL